MEPAVLEAGGWAMGCRPKEKILLCHGEAGAHISHAAPVRDRRLQKGLGHVQGAKAAAPRSPCSESPQCSCLGCAPASLPQPWAPTLPMDGSLAPPAWHPLGGHGGAWPAMSLPCAGAGQEQDGAGRAVAGDGSRQHSPSCRGRLLVWGWQEPMGGRGQLHPVTLP